MEKYKISASIVTFRNPIEDIIQAAESILDSDVEVHLAIIDNCSENGLVEQLEQRLSCDIVQTGSNDGFGFAHNIGMQRAPTSDYYLVANPDVVVHPGSLRRMVKFMDQNSEVGLLCPKILNEDGTCQHLNKLNPTVIDFFLRRFLPEIVQALPVVQCRMDSYVMNDFGYDSSYEVPYMSGCFMLFRRSVLEQLGGFDERFFMYLEDADITRRVNEIAKAVFYPKAVITHKWARGSHHSLKLTFVTIQSAIYYFNKWGLKWW